MSCRVVVDSVRVFLFRLALVRLSDGQIKNNGWKKLVVFFEAELFGGGDLSCRRSSWMDFPIQHYSSSSSKENGSEQELQQSLAMRTEWEPCLAHHPPLQSFGCADAELAERGGGGVGIGGGPPPPPPPSKRRFRSPTSRNKPNNDNSAMCATGMDDRHGKMRETLMGRQVRETIYILTQLFSPGRLTFFS